MTETQAYIELVLYLGTILSLPFIFRVFSALGKLAVIFFFPPKTVTFEIKLKNGHVVKKKVNIADNKELIDTILSSNGRVIY